MLGSYTTHVIHPQTVSLVHLVVLLTLPYKQEGHARVTCALTETIDPWSLAALVAISSAVWTQSRLGSDGVTLPCQGQVLSPVSAQPGKCSARSVHKRMAT